MTNQYQYSNNSSKLYLIQISDSPELTHWFPKPIIGGHSDDIILDLDNTNKQAKYG